ncbi:MAG: GAF and ANTAR domain-containing protein [Propionibacteriaceae bacterium]
MNALLAEQPGLSALLRRLVVEAVRSTFADVAAIVLTTDDTVVAAVSSDEAATATARSGGDDQEGPTRQSLVGRTDVMVADIGHDPRWPQWGLRVADSGLLSLVSKRLLISAQTSGVLTLYARRIGGFAPEDLDVAEFFSRYASSAIASAVQRDSLLAASETRHAIGLAEGILMQRHELSAEAAFTRLRRLGRENSTTLLATAEHVVSEPRD